MSQTKIICLAENLASFASGYWGEHGLAFYIQAGEYRHIYRRKG